MGYCLLYEGMLESVLWARDRYLKPSGLMVPSHVTMHIAPISDPAYIADQVTYWKDVHGFSMESMLENSYIYTHILPRIVKASSLVADPGIIFHANLHHERVEKNRKFKERISMITTRDIESLDGFAIWFDTFFASSHDGEIPSSARGESWPGEGGTGGAFTTGPNGPSTHWEQGSLLINRTGAKAVPVKKGTELIALVECEQNGRDLLLEMKWRVGNLGETEQGRWYMNG